MAILGVGQMGLVCANLLTDPDRAWSPGGLGYGGDGGPTAAAGRAGPAAPPPVAPASVTLWAHSADEAGRLAQTRRSDRLEGFVLNDAVRVSMRDREAVEKADLIVSAIPVQYSRAVWERLGGYIPPGAQVVSVAKGIENGTLLRPTQVIAEVLDDDADAPPRGLATLSGPTIAPELARCLPATMVAAADDEALRCRVQELFSTRWLRVYTSADLVGVELAGAIKNVIAIAAGILDGLQAGNNAKSALLARGVAELARLGTAMGASPDTFFGIAGVGDLATSCFSPEGRNRSCGEALGRGARLEDYLATQRHVVEGIATARSVADLARKYRVEMPIAAAVHSVLFEGLDPIQAIGRLMTRHPKPERVG